MSALSSSLEGRAFQNFLGQLIKYIFYADNNVSIESISILFESIDLDAASVEAEISTYAQVRYLMCSNFCFGGFVIHSVSGPSLLLTGIAEICCGELEALKDGKVFESNSTIRIKYAIISNDMDKRTRENQSVNCQRVCVERALPPFILEGGRTH